MSVPFHKQTDPNKQAGQHVYGFDREPYLKHSNVAPDVTLSDYIARKQEEPKRMTFDEWWLSNPLGLDSHQYEVAQMTWNAALKQGKL
jgi:hypothetical protein